MEDNINQIISLSKDKKILLNKILDLTNKQKMAIEDDDLDYLGLILEDKDNLMNKIDKIDIEFIKLYNTIKKTEDISTFDEIDVEKYNNIKDLKDIVNDINKVLTEISNKDKENRRIMKLSLDNVKLDIKNVKKGQKAYKGYNYESTSSMLIDEKK